MAFYLLIDLIVLYFDRVAVDESRVELLGGHHLLLEDLEVVLHQGGLVCLPWLAGGGEAWVGAPEHKSLPRSHGAVSEHHRDHPQAVLGQQGLKSGEKSREYVSEASKINSLVFAQMQDALEGELHPVIAQPGDLLERLLELEHGGARLVPVTLAQHAP